jgi:hypothetical protein
MALSNEARPTKVAEDTAASLKRYVSTGWKVECELLELPESADFKRRLMHHALRLNNGNTIESRQLYNILQKRRCN